MRKGIAKDMEGKVTMSREQIIQTTIDLMLEIGLIKLEEVEKTAVMLDDYSTEDLTLIMLETGKANPVLRALAKSNITTMPMVNNYCMN